jgi:circadian clock protein KaiC
LHAIERIPTGIPGLDEMIGGGLPVPSLTLVAGDVGSGKTTLCTQFLCKGAEVGERGIYFMTSGGPKEWAFKFISTYDFVEECYFDDDIKFIELKTEEAGGVDDMLEVIRSEMEDVHPRRIAVDSLFIVDSALKKDCRHFVMKLSSLVKEHGAVALVTAESLPGAPYPVKVAQVVDGVILLQNTEVDMVRKRTIEVLKMSGTAHHLGQYAVDISARGLTVYPGL